MSNNSPENGASTASLRSWHGWWPLAVTLSLSAVLVAIILWDREDKPLVPSMPNASPDAVAQSRIRFLPPPPDAAEAISDAPSMCYSVVSEQRDGAQVLRIRTHAEGDELIIDAITGRLVAVRDSKGKTIARPASPVNVIEQPPTAS